VSIRNDSLKALVGEAIDRLDALVVELRQLPTYTEVGNVARSCEATVNELEALLRRAADKPLVV
jgi:hypothetical protein